MSRHPARFLAASLLLAAAASVAEERIDVVSEGGAGKHWTPPAAAPVPAYPSVVAENDQVCVGIGYLIEKDGSTGGFLVLKSWSRTHGQGDEAAPALEPFQRNALAAVQQWKFTPVKPGKERKIYTASTFAFDRDANGDVAALRAHCEIDNLTAFIAKARSDAYRTGNMKKGELERYRQGPLDAAAPRSGRQ